MTNSRPPRMYNKNSSTRLHGEDGRFVKRAEEYRAGFDIVTNARVGHICSRCSGRIERGEIYRREKWIVAVGSVIRKVCSRCMNAER